MSVAVKVDVWSDVACPWCYIGKRNVEQAVAELREGPDPIDVEIEYHSFQLAPDMPDDFAGREIDYLVERKGVSEARARAMMARVTAVAADVGLDYDLDALRPANTRKAHELLHYAKAHGRQAEVKEGLLRAHFVEGRHVGHDDELAEVAAAAGLDRQDVLRSLEEGEYRTAVAADRRLAVEHGIQGVPFFVIDGRVGLSGAQAPATFVRALRQAAEASDEVVAG